MIMQRYWRGVRCTKRSQDMITEAERLAGFTFVITQGSYNPGGVKASAGVHDREAFDFSTGGCTLAEKLTMVKCLRRVGFVAYLRLYIRGLWPEHIHTVPRGGDLSTPAQHQVGSYLAHRNGLANNAPDPDPGWCNVTWEQYVKTRQGAGWFHVNPDKITTTLAGLTVGRRVKLVRKPNANLYIVRFETRWGRLNGVTDHGTYYAMDYLTKGKAA